MFGYLCLSVEPESCGTLSQQFRRNNIPRRAEVYSEHYIKGRDLIVFVNMSRRIVGFIYSGINRILLIRS